MTTERDKRLEEVIELPSHSPYNTERDKMIWRRGWLDCQRAAREAISDEGSGGDDHQYVPCSDSESHRWAKKEGGGYMCADCGVDLDDLPDAPPQQRKAGAERQLSLQRCEALEALAKEKDFLRATSEILRTARALKPEFRETVAGLIDIFRRALSEQENHND